MFDLPDDAFREQPVLESMVKDAADAIQTEYERRVALEGLAAWHMGYRWLLVIRPNNQPTTMSALDGFDMKLRAAFQGRHRKPHPNALPENARNEVIDLSVLDHKATRRRVWNEVKNSDHA